MFPDVYLIADQVERIGHAHVRVQVHLRVGVFVVDRDHLTAADLDLGDASLVFGRIDRAAEAPDAIESFHIGRLAVADESGMLDREVDLLLEVLPLNNLIQEPVLQ